MQKKAGLNFAVNHYERRSVLTHSGFIIRKEPVFRKFLDLFPGAGGVSCHAGGKGFTVGG